MYTVIRGDMTAEIARALQKLRPENLLCEWDTQRFDQEMKRLRPPLNAITGHSFKKGAASHIVNRVTNEGVPLDPRHLSLLLKHKLTADLIANSTLRYPALGPNLARWLGTGTVTEIL